MTGICTRLADALLVHAPRHENNGVDLWLACGCGDGVRYYDRRKHVAHVESALLSLPGIAIVELPEPDDDGIAFWWQAAVVGVDDGAVVTALDPDSEQVWLSPEVARTYAAALLAAANTAEAES